MQVNLSKMQRSWSIKAEYMARPKARGDAWVYFIEQQGKSWGVLVDEKIRYKTLFEPGSETHDDLDEVIVPIEGRYWVKVGTWSRTLSPGETAIIPAGTAHDSGIATNLVGTHFLVLLFSKQLEVLRDTKPGGVALPPGSLSWLKGMFRFLKHGANHDSLIPVTALPVFLKRIASKNRLGPDHSHPDPVVSQVVRLLEQPDTPSLTELAKQVGLTPSHLQRRFAAAVGFSPLQYANAWKLDVIASMIKAGSALPLVELAAEYGFNDVKHFRTLFQRRFDMPPSAYRKNPPPEK